MDIRELVKLFRTGSIGISKPGLTITDKVTSCYTLDNEDKTYVVIKFSNGQAVVDPKNIVSDPNIYYEWRYNILDSNNEILCSIVKLKKEWWYDKNSYKSDR